MLRHWQLLAAAIWGTLAVLIFFRESLFEPEQVDRFPVRNWTMANLICAFLAIWNVARWYQANAARRAAEPVRKPLQPNPDAPQGYEYIPEFDFQKQDAEEKKNDPG